MKVKINYSRCSSKFFVRQDILGKAKTDELLISAIRIIYFNEDLNIDLKSLKGFKTRMYRIRYRDTRVIFSTTKTDIIEVDVIKIGFRQNFYT